MCNLRAHRRYLYTFDTLNTIYVLVFIIFNHIQYEHVFTTLLNYSPVYPYNGFCDNIGKQIGGKVPAEKPTCQLRNVGALIYTTCTFSTTLTVSLRKEINVTLEKL